jgi:hypothetical protein
LASARRWDWRRVSPKCSRWRAPMTKRESVARRGRRFHDCRFSAGKVHREVERQTRGIRFGSGMNAPVLTIEHLRRWQWSRSLCGGQYLHCRGKRRVSFDRSLQRQHWAPVAVWNDNGVVRKLRPCTIDPAHDASLVAVGMFTAAGARERRIASRSSMNRGTKPSGGRFASRGP